MSSSIAKKEQPVCSNLDDLEQTQNLMQWLCVAIHNIGATHSYASTVLIEKINLHLMEQKYNHAKIGLESWKARIECPKIVGSFVDTGNVKAEIIGWTKKMTHLDEEVITATDALSKAEEEFRDNLTSTTAVLAGASQRLETWLARQREVKLVRRAREEATSKIEKITTAWATVTVSWERVEAKVSQMLLAEPREEDCSNTTAESTVTDSRKGKFFELGNMQQVANMLESTFKLAIMARDSIIHKIDKLHFLVHEMSIDDTKHTDTK
jgi:hypothetical protein